jgi:HD-GYP domain-containing protein (c-di-GMP phosphodiesterase class II)
MNLDSYNTPEAEALLEIGKQRTTHALERRRELTTQIVAAAGFLLAASLLAALAPWHGPINSGHLLLAIAMYLAVELVRFPVGGGATHPTMLAFVPMLFLLPTPVVPLVAMASILIGGIPRYALRKSPLTRLASDIADAWYSVGPAVVLVLAGVHGFAWSDWPVFVGAFAAQVGFDVTATIARCSIGEGINPRVQMPLLSWIYATDAALWPLGLMIAAVATERPGLVLLALSPTAMLYLFARERQQRLDNSVALSTAYRGTALLLGDVIEADDEYTGSHSRDVVDLSLAVADALGLDLQRRQNVEFAALLHDVGKIRVPKEILNKRSELNSEETILLRRHTIDGEMMLKQVGGTLSSVGRIVRATHERFDGGGYPDGLAAEEIPIEARIICACDAFSAMTTNRPYRAALPVRRAITELKLCSESQFDPAVVDALVGTVLREGFAVERPSQATVAPGRVLKLGSPVIRSAVAVATRPLVARRPVETAACESVSAPVGSAR